MQLTIDKQSVLQVLGDKGNLYLIPDYQRPYSWQDDQILTLFDDLRMFAVSGGSAVVSGLGGAGAAPADKEAPEYFLGAVVTYQSDADASGRQEIIDGQQRLTSLTLLLRALYQRMQGKTDENSKTVRKTIERCVWRTQGPADEVMSDFFKLDSDSALDEDKEELRKILTNGWANPLLKSNYAKAYRLFSKLVKEMEEQNKYEYLPVFSHIVLEQVVLLPIRTESQTTALTVFNTINDRGLPLRDSDIYKSRMYKFFLGKGKKDGFVPKWKELEERCANLRRKKGVAPMDELFQRYTPYQLVHWERKDGLQGVGNKPYLNSAKTRKFLAKDSYKVLSREEALGELDDLSRFWAAADKRTEFSKRIDNLLLVLSLSPYESYRNALTTYFMRNKRILQDKDDEGFFSLLDRLAACIAGFSVMNLPQGMAAALLYDEMRKIERGSGGDFAGVRFRRLELEAAYFDKEFTNTRPASKYLMTWRALIYPDKSPKLAEGMRLEDLSAAPDKASAKERAAYARLGNKVLVDGSFKIPRSCRSFAQRRLFLNQAGTNVELIELLSAKNFSAQDIALRDDAILTDILDGLETRGVLRL